MDRHYLAHGNDPGQIGTRSLARWEAFRLTKFGTGKTKSAVFCSALRDVLKIKKENDLAISTAYGLMIILELSFLIWHRLC